MKRINFLITGTVSIVFISGIILFIINNNDHAECETIYKSFTAPTGEKISTEEHICREVFNF